MPVNVSPEYVQAELKFSKANTDEEKISALEEMMKTMPGHKGAESLRAQLRTRYKKLKEKLEIKGKKSGGGGRSSIRKDDMQATIVGFANSGKSHLFKILTNQETQINNIPFSTSELVPGTMKHEDVQIQIIDTPSFPNEDKSTINNTDLLLVVIDNISQINDSGEYLKKSTAKKIYIFTKTDLISETEKRKLEATLKSKYKNINYILFSNINFSQEELNNLKQKIFSSFPTIRVYTKEPKKESTGIPMILPIDSTPKDVAEKIINGLSRKIKQTRIWGPSSKFPGQVVGLNHKLKDKDMIEFQTE